MGEAIQAEGIHAEYSAEDHALHMGERKVLIEAARESARTFDQAVLAFGSAVFGFSIAFLKDVAPHPVSTTLKWLAFAWGLFSSGLLAIMLSFLFSHKACMREIEIGTQTLLKSDDPPGPNIWSSLTDLCNYLSVTLLFAGMICWSVFAFENLNYKEKEMSQPPPSSPKEDRGYTPPRTPPPPPSRPPTPPPPKN